MPFIIDSAEDVPSLEPIAIVGMACRLPGSIDSASSLWDVLQKKGSVQTPRVPSNRFNIDAHYHPDLSRPGSFHSLGGYFLDGDLADFDPSFFGMTPIEAMWLDPQQRKMLEVSYECLESAGLSLDQVAGSNTAVFVGSFTSDYQQMSTRETDFRHSYTATGVDVGIISNRIGNTFNLNGPRLVAIFTINTACSSSIYAIHNACHALRTGDCEAAIAGGVNLILSVDQHMNTAKLSILSPTSTCHTFDAAADGYGRAEGAGALYLKRLSDAIRDNDAIRGIIRSSAVNTNGKIEGMGLTHPSVQGQERVVRAAYKRAGLDPKDTVYLECHGTGTPVGDPIEVRAVSNAMNDNRSQDAPLLIGAIKANIGHSEAASGIFAAMKAAMMTESATIPGVCGLQNINPAIKEADWNVSINVDTKPWPQDSDLRRVSVSSFGYGGTNGHVIIESVDRLCPWYQHGKPKAVADYQYNLTRPLLIGMSAHSKKTLVQNIDAHAKIFDKYHLPDIAYTLNSRRTQFASRGYTIACEGQEVAAFNHESFAFASAGKTATKVAFVFTGQGAQWQGMGFEAIRAFPTFAKTIDALDSILGQYVSPTPTWKLREILESPATKPSRMSEAELSQPLCTAIQIATVDLFASWNITPAVTVGHSSGEIAAAYAAGRLSAPEAILAAFFRGVAVKRAAPVGTMLAVGLGANEAQHFIDESTAKYVSIACENSPSSVTLSGTIDGITAVKEKFDDAKIFARELRTGKAYHSSQMNAVAPLYSSLFMKTLESLDDVCLDWRHPSVPMVSSVTGELLAENDVSIQYWCNNLRSRVLFNSALSTLGSEFSDIKCLVEIGPHSALAGPIKQICSSNQFTHLNYTPSLLRGSDSLMALLKTAGELYVKGVPVDMASVNRIADPQDAQSFIKRNAPRYLVDLPPYQWNYDDKFWYEPRFSEEQRRSKYTRHDILGRKIFGMSDKAHAWKNILREKDVPWLSDHRLGDAIVFPAAGHLSLAIEAYMQALDLEETDLAGVILRDVNIKAALIVPKTDDGIEIQTNLNKVSQKESDDVWYEFTVESIDHGVWTTHSEGKICASPSRSRSGLLDCTFTDNKLHQRTLAKRWYDSFKLVGFEYGPSFQTLKDIRTNGKDRYASAEVHVTDKCGALREESRYMLHPSTIDGCLQLLNVSVHSGLHKGMPFGVVPLEAEEVSLYFPGSDCSADGHAAVWTEKLDGRYFNTNVKLTGASGNALMDIKNMRSVSYEAAIPQWLSDPLPREPYSQVSWRPDVTTLSEQHKKALFTSDISREDCIAKMVSLLNHLKPIQNVLMLGNSSSSLVKAIQSSLQPIAEMTIGLASEDQTDEIDGDLCDSRSAIIDLPENISDIAESIIEKTDLFVITEHLLCSSDLLEVLNQHAFKGAHLIVLPSEADTKALIALETSVKSVVPQLNVDFRSNGIRLGVGEPRETTIAPFKRHVAVLSTMDSDATSERIVKGLKEQGCEVVVSKIDDFKSNGQTEIIINDQHGTSLTSPTKESFDALKAVLCSGNSIAWLTKGVNQGESVSGGASVGFLRSVRSEQAAATISLVDIDQEVTSEELASTLLDKLAHNVTKDSGLDTEFWVQSGGIVYIPRFIPQDTLNALVSDDSSSAVDITIENDVAYKSSFASNGLVFEAQHHAVTDPKLGSWEAEVQVTLSEMSREHLSVSSESIRIIVGKVLEVGAQLDPSLLGCNVVAFAKGSFETRARTANFVTLPSTLQGETISQLAGTLPSICKAVDAAVVTGKAKEGSHVLVLNSDSQFISAVRDLSKILSFQVSYVVEDNKQKEVRASRFQIESHSLILASDEEALRDLLVSSNSPNVVIANSFSHLGREVWRFMPAMSKFVLCDAPIESQLDMLPLSKGVSFLTTGISTLFARSPSSLNNVLRRTVELVCNNAAALLQDVSVTDIGALDGKQRASRDGVPLKPGVVEVRYGQSVVKAPIKQEDFRFHADAAYLLVGCLGGLGRSLTVWMLEHGCRNFVFLSRSGADKPEAAEVVFHLRDAGASVEVFCADAGNEKVVADVVSMVSSKIPIRGVVHAAMVLQDGMFEGMTYEKYMSAVKPKVLGAMSLHKALKDTPLDFFLMTSSISATLGNPGQANYAAGNSFLEALAWYRRKHGLAASTINLPMILDVGVVAENQDIELSLNRKGMYGIDEREMLAAFETGMRQGPLRNGEANIGDTQIGLGMEPAYLAAAMSSSDSMDVYWANDARLNNIRATVDSLFTSGADKTGSAGNFVASLSGKSQQEVLQSIKEHIIKRCSSILMIPVEGFDTEDTSVGSYGLDSMIGAELRTWLFKELGLDIGFQVLLGPTLTFSALAKMVAEQLGLLA